MDKTVKSFIKQYGSLILIEENNTTIKRKGFLYPLYNRSKYYHKIKLLTAGRFDDTHYLLITEPNSFSDENSEAVVYYKGDKYLAKNNGTYVLNDKEIYVWAVLTAYTNPLEDDYDKN